MADEPALDLTTIAMALQMSADELAVGIYGDASYAELPVLVARQGLALNSAFVRLRNPTTRQRVVLMVEALADYEAASYPKVDH